MSKLHRARLFMVLPGRVNRVTDGESRAVIGCGIRFGPGYSEKFCRDEARDFLRPVEKFWQNLC